VEDGSPVFGCPYLTAKALDQAVHRMLEENIPYLVVFYLTDNSVFRIFNPPKNEEL
jgi:hypothetical protein